MYSGSLKYVGYSEIGTVFVEFIGSSISTLENILLILQILFVTQLSLLETNLQSPCPVKDIFVDDNKQISNVLPLSIL